MKAKSSSFVTERKGFRPSDPALAPIWLAVTLLILAVYPLYSDHPEAWDQGVIPAFLGVVGGWVSLRLFYGSVLQRTLSAIAFCFWLFFLAGWARQVILFRLGRWEGSRDELSNTHAS